MAISAESEIRSLVARYAHAVVARDPSAWAATWADDGCWQIMGAEPRGRAEVLAHWEKLMAGIFFVFQMAGEGSVTVEPSGDRGAGVFPTVEFLKLTPDAAGSLMIGTYRDAYVKEDGAWKFSRRSIEVQYMGPSDLSAAPLSGARAQG